MDLRTAGLWRWTTTKATPVAFAVWSTSTGQWLRSPVCHLCLCPICCLDNPEHHALQQPVELGVSVRPPLWPCGRRLEPDANVMSAWDRGSAVLRLAGSVQANPRWGSQASLPPSVLVNSCSDFLGRVFGPTVRHCSLTTSLRFQSDLLFAPDCCSVDFSTNRSLIF